MGSKALCSSDLLWPFKHLFVWRRTCSFCYSTLWFIRKKPLEPLHAFMQLQVRTHFSPKLFLFPEMALGFVTLHSTVRKMLELITGTFKHSIIDNLRKLHFGSILPKICQITILKLKFWICRSFKGGWIKNLFLYGSMYVMRWPLRSFYTLITCLTLTGNKV